MAAPSLPPAAESSAEPAAEPATGAAPPGSSGPRWEGAIGPLAAYRPEYTGADRRVVKFTPGFFLRYGRLTITNVSGFRTRSEGEVARGASLDLLSNQRVRLSLALRLDRGRDEGSAAAFRGLGDVRTSVRLHANLQWRFSGPLSLGLNWNLDALGRGGGHAGSLGLGWETRLGPHSGVHWYGGVSVAGDRYMQSYFGVTPEQSAVSGYPAYRPKAGLRASEASISYRTDLTRDWLLIAGVSASHLLGPAAASPLTKQLDGWEVRSGVAWRF